jgi:PleD family two-component response regulator
MRFAPDLEEEYRRFYLSERRRFGVVTISVGVAVIRPALERSPEGAAQLADEALYAAKRDGRNRVHVFESEYQGLSTGTFRIQ